jgi:acetolactate synthase-1/3 small subunit
VLELVTRDAMGAVRHVAAWLARRAYPLLGLICLRDGDGAGRLVLAVADDGRLDRLLLELARLPDVAAARRCDPMPPSLAAVMGEALAV